jgi:DNA-binding NtrC family response regulator
VLDVDYDPWLLTSAVRVHVARVVGECGGDKTFAAKLLGVSRRKLYRLLDAHGVRETVRRRQDVKAVLARRRGESI